MRGFIDQEAADAELGIDKVMLMGFFPGLLHGFETALRSAERFAGIVGISGYLPNIDKYPQAFGAAARDQAIWLSHGRYDEVLPLDATETVKNSLENYGCKIEWSVYSKDHSLDPEQELPTMISWIHEHLGQTGASE